MAKRYSTASVRVGISGWTYTPWRGTFYPKKLAHKNELAYASAMLPSIEINGTFYSLQRPKSFATWYDQTPTGFVFSLKAPRFITHMRRLRDVEIPIANFFSSGVLRLNEKLGPVLWQLPPNLQYDAKVIDEFLRLLPRTTADAARRAKQVDKRMNGRTWSTIDRDRPMRHAMEVRHESFKNIRFVEQLRRRNVALVVADTAGKWPVMEDVTADFLYLRLHGEEELYVSGYTDAALDRWAKKITRWQKGTEPVGAKRMGPAAVKTSGRDVYAYFDNDVKVRSPFDAARLGLRLKLRQAALPEAAEVGDVKEVPRAAWPPMK